MALPLYAVLPWQEGTPAPPLLHRKTAGQGQTGLSFPYAGRGPAKGSALAWIAGAPGGLSLVLPRVLLGIRALALIRFREPVTTAAGLVVGI